MAAAPHLDSERFRTCPKTYRPPCGRLRLRKTARKGSVACQGPDRWHPLKAGGEEVPIVNMRWRELTGGAASPGHRGQPMAWRRLS